MNNKEKIISYIRLINTSGIGVATFHKLLNKFGNIESMLSAVEQKYQLFPKIKAEQEVMEAEIKGIKIITLEDEIYPYNLRQIEDCPPLLYALGNIGLLKNNNALAVVGSRTASLSALKLAEKLSKELALQNITIVSGMARGIDAAAHQGALKANGQTIAVLGTGINIVYPKENEELYKNLAKNGLILSEYPLNTPAQASNFPRRNRIVSGLSKATLVVEAGIKSGSLITAHIALEQGRDIFAVPGSPYDGRASGCNKLIKEGAFLVEDAQDIINNFSFSEKIFTPVLKKENETADLFEYLLDNEKNNKDIARKNKDTLKDDRELSPKDKLLSLVSVSGENIDELIRISGLSSEEVLIMLIELEFEGKIIRIPNNRVAKT